MLAPAMPLVIQRKKMFIGLLGLAVNSEFHYPNYFVITPGGPSQALVHQGLFRRRGRPEPPGRPPWPSSPPTRSSLATPRTARAKTRPGLA